MTWLVFTSLRRNLAKYWLALVGIAASVAVSCLGLSGANLMHNLARHPVALAVGGDMIIVDAGVEFHGSRLGVHTEGMFPMFEFDGLRALVETELPATKVTGSLFAPALSAESTSVGVLLGRYDPTGHWLYRPALLSGAFPDLAGGREYSLVVGGRRGSARNRVPGSIMPVRVPHYESTSGGEMWDFSSGILEDYTISGVCDGRFNSGYLWTPLATAQEHLGVSGKVAWAGVAAGDVNALDKTTERVSALISRERPDLQVISVDEFAEMMVADFQRFKATSMFYGPVIILISIQIVIATALAMAFSRRRELAVLRTSGLGAAQVRLLFVLESTLISVLGAVAGYLFSLLAAQSIFQGRSVNLLPGVAAVLVTAVVAAVCSRYVVLRDVANVLRNP